VLRLRGRPLIQLQPHRAGHPVTQRACYLPNNGNRTRYKTCCCVRVSVTIEIIIRGKMKFVDQSVLQRDEVSMPHVH
jgi:hypothetical protein